MFIVGLHELVDQGGCGGEAHRDPSLTGCQSQPQGHVGLAGAAVAHGDDVLTLVYVLATGQLHDQLFVQRGDGQEVEGVQALYGWEAGRPDSTFHHAVMAVYEFKLRQPEQVVGMVHTL